MPATRTEVAQLEKLVHFRIEEFVVVTYDRDPDKTKHNVTSIYTQPDISFVLLRENNVPDKIFVDFTISLSSAAPNTPFDPEKNVCAVRTRSRFHIEGAEGAIDQGDGRVNINVPKDLLYELVSAAYSTTRGYIHSISAGEFLIPIISPHNMANIEMKEYPTSSVPSPPSSQSPSVSA